MLFIVALEDVFKNLAWERKGVNIDGKFPSHLRFIDDIILMNIDTDELGDILKELVKASEAGTL